MSSDPERLLDDSSMPDLLREDLAETANQPLPRMDMAAGVASLKAAISAGGGAMAGSTSASATANAASLAHGSWWGGALIGLGVGLVGAAVIWFAPPLPGSPAPPLPPRIEVAAPLPVAEPAPIPAPIASSAPLLAERSASPAPRAPSAISAPAPSSTPTASASAEPANGPAEELALLVQIKQRAASDPAGAVALVDEGHRRFPRGSFYQERESIAVLALAQIGRSTEARERAQRFLAAHPQSPYAERLRALAPPP